MAQNTPIYDDEIDLIELIQLVIAHKAKYIILGLIGLVLGSVYTFNHKPRFATSFKAHLGHPAFDSNFLINSAEVQDLLNRSELDKSLIPSLSFNPKTQVFEVVSDTDTVQVAVTQIFTEALDRELSTFKLAANNFNGFSDKSPVIINNNNNNNNNLTWTNQDIAKLDSGAVLQSLTLSFGQPKGVYPDPVKHGLFGVIVGLILGFVWMLAAILARQLKAR
jgi:hypothetical protein